MPTSGFKVGDRVKTPAGITAFVVRVTGREVEVEYAGGTKRRTFHPNTLRLCDRR